jgi:hypothetical protein
MNEAYNASALLDCSKKPQALARGSFLRSFFSGRQAFPVRTSQNAAPTL